MQAAGLHGEPEVSISSVNNLLMIGSRNAAYGKEKIVRAAYENLDPTEKGMLEINLTVFPEPVCAIPIRSWLFIKTRDACF